MKALNANAHHLIANNGLPLNKVHNFCFTFTVRVGRYAAGPGQKEEGKQTQHITYKNAGNFRVHVHTNKYY